MRHVASCCVLFLGVALAACGSDATPGGSTTGSSGAGGAAAAGGAIGASGAVGTSGAVGASGAPGASGAVGTSGAVGAAGSSASSGSGGASTAGTGGTGTGGSSAGTGGMDWPVGPDPGTDGDGKITVTNMTKQPELGNQGNPAGKEFIFKLTSKSYQFTEPTITNCTSPKNQPRTVWVYVPDQYKDGTAAPFMVIQDGQQGSGTGGRYGSIKFALDNLTVSTVAGRKIPPFIAIAVQDGGGDGPNCERGLEYDTVSDRYALFVQNEVLPAVAANADIKATFPGFKLTDNPEGRATFGCSSGAAAAFTMAWFHPELFRRVVAYSATLVAQQNTKQPEHAMYPDGAWDYHHNLNLIAKADLKPLRIMNNANEHDNGYDQPESGAHNWLIANQATSAALLTKHYHNRFVYGVGVGHCDDNLLRATLADSLVWVWRGYAP